MSDRLLNGAEIPNVYFHASIFNFNGEENQKALTDWMNTILMRQDSKTAAKLSSDLKECLRQSINFLYINLT